jgi:glutamine amidotransferase
MTKDVTIIDYGVGNLYSVVSALEHSNGKPQLTNDPDAVAKADRLVLPGVGAFAFGMEALARLGLVEAVRAYAAAGKPLLGICLGLQFLFDYSEEHGRHEGLGLIPGSVVRIPNVGADGQPHKIPHIGWSAIQPRAGETWCNSLLADVPIGSTMYFVHSFTAFPAKEEYRLADADYHGCRVSAAVSRDNITGCQFHPERSGAIGLRIIERFLTI